MLFEKSSEEKSSMKITDVRIKLSGLDLKANEHLLAFASITIDNSFVVHDLRIIAGKQGCFVSMPSRRLTDSCFRCRTKNHLMANYCTRCGLKLTKKKILPGVNGRPKLYADIVHPINSSVRDMMEKIIMEAYNQEKEIASLPGYKSRYYDHDDHDDYDENEN